MRRMTACVSYWSAVHDVLHWIDFGDFKNIIIAEAGV